MRRFFSVLLGLMLAAGGCSLAGCGDKEGGGGGGGQATDYGKYESVADKAPDASFAFETELPDKGPAYPLSRGRTFYVSTSGSDDNSGLTEDKPVLIGTLPSLVFQAGDSILFKRGETFDGQIRLENLAGEDDNPITVASYGTGEKPVIADAADVVVFNACSNLVIRDLDIRVTGVERTDGLPFTRTGILGNYNFVGQKKYRNIYIVNNTVSGGGITKNVMGITVSSVESTFANCPDRVLTGVHIYGNTVRDIGRSGIHVSGWLTNEKINQNNGLMTLFNEVYINGNTIRDVGNIGIYIAGCTVSTINRNLVYNTGMYTSAQIAEGECGIMALSADTMDIMYNVSYNNFDSKLTYDAMAIDIDWNTTNINVQYNHAYDCMGGGIGTMANQNSFVRNNRIENNLCATNQTAQLQVSDFTSRYAAVADDMHAVRNLKITDNLIVGTPDNKSMFRAQKFNGDSDWSGNEFTGNRVVYTGDNVNSIYFNYVDTEVPWYKFGDNRYFSGDTSIFKCFDYTAYTDINYDEGAQPYVFTKDFASWTVRDLGATYDKLTDYAPSIPSAPSLTYEGGSVKAAWTSSKGDLWHYNVFAAGEGEEVSYLNLLGETTAPAFEYRPEHKGTFYLVIQPESNEGVCGKALKIKVELN